MIEIPVNGHSIDVQKMERKLVQGARGMDVFRFAVAAAVDGTDMTDAGLSWYLHISDALGNEDLFLLLPDTEKDRVLLDWTVDLTGVSCGHLFMELYCAEASDAGDGTDRRRWGTMIARAYIHPSFGYGKGATGKVSLMEQYVAQMEAILADCKAKQGTVTSDQMSVAAAKTSAVSDQLAAKDAKEKALAASASVGKHLVEIDDELYEVSDTASGDRIVKTFTKTEAGS